MNWPPTRRRGQGGGRGSRRRTGSTMTSDLRYETQLSLESWLMKLFACYAFKKHWYPATLNPRETVEIKYYSRTNQLIYQISRVLTRRTARSAVRGRRRRRLRDTPPAHRGRGAKKWTQERRPFPATDEGNDDALLLTHARRLFFDANVNFFFERYSILQRVNKIRRLPFQFSIRSFLTFEPKRY